MFVLVSPTKTQKSFKGESKYDSLFTDESHKILKILQNYTLEELQKNMKLSDKLSQSVYDTIQKHKKENIAINTYKGASFNSLDTPSWSDEDYLYAQEHLYILSALYGLLRPLDTIGLYRLDFLMTFEIDLYSYWQDLITEHLNDRAMPIINLASQEYSKMFHEKNLKVPLIRVDFKELTDKGYVSKSTYAKIARGKCTQLIIKNKIQSLHDLKQIEFDDYRYNKALSDESNFIFTR